MRKTLKRVIAIVGVIALLLVELAVPSQNAKAADVNEKAEMAFAEALVQEKIKYGGEYCLCDINSDGVKELLVTANRHSSKYDIWKYANGKVSKVAEFDKLYFREILAYDKKTKTFWRLGEDEGDEVWMTAYKLKNGKVKKTGTRYEINNGIAKKISKKAAKIITFKEYSKKQNNIKKNNAIKMKEVKKTMLIAKLQKKEYTPQSFHLTTDWSKCKGIMIEEVTSKYIKYKKVSIQSSSDGEETGYYPYDNAIYKMRYSKKIDVYLLADRGSGWGADTKFVKAYSGISYKKMKECFNKFHTTFALVKNKRGAITKMVELFES